MQPLRTKVGVYQEAVEAQMAVSDLKQSKVPHSSLLTHHVNRLGLSLFTDVVHITAAQRSFPHRIYFCCAANAGGQNDKD